MHEKVYCTQCHARPIFTDVGKNCADCHADIHRRQFGANCAGCHTVQGWQVSTQLVKQHFNRFPLLGAHAVVQCDECHKSAAVGQYLGLSTACVSCHSADFQKATVPNHVTGKFSSTCEACHTSVDSWFGTAAFNHSATGFALTGMHVSPSPTPCVSCHVNNNYTLSSAACYGCHADKWQSTTTLGGNVPNHILSGYPTTCESCHTTNSWSGAVFNHSATGFPLTGAHTSVACSLCHITSATPPTDCYSCHTAQWQSTAKLGGSVPNHVAAGASAAGIVTSACSTCHNTTSWLGATFTHNFWSVNHGNASGVCAACHSDSANYVIFMCSNGACHTRPGIDNTHQGNGSFVWSSGVTCYRCHQNGGGGG
jgi:hypothetical protein